MKKTIVLLILFVVTAFPGLAQQRGRVEGQWWGQKHAEVTTGDIFFVDSSTGSDDVGTNGRSALQPFATIDYAVGQCTANQGCTIYAMPNHAETCAASSCVDIDVAGVSIIGLGEGDNRPTITFATSTAADWDVDAADALIENIVFACNIASQVAMIDISANGDGAVIRNSDFREGSATGLAFIVISGVANDVQITGNRFYQPTAGNGDHAIAIDAAALRLLIRDNFIFGDFDDATVHSASAFLNSEISDNTIVNLLTGVHAIELTAAATGVISNNRLSNDDVTAVLDPGSMRNIGNLWNTTGDFEGTPPLPVADSANNFIGVDDSNNVAATSSVADNRDGSLLERSETIIATLRDDVASNYIGLDDADNVAATTSVAANADGSVLERLEQIQEAINPGSGTSLAATESVADILYATNGVATYPTAAQAANGVSIAEVLRYVSEAQVPRMESTNIADLTGYDTAAEFTVTGNVLVRCVGAVGATAITSTSGTTTLALGTTADTDAILAATTVENTDFAIGDAWTDNNPEDDASSVSTAAWVVVSNGADIVLTRNVDDLTAGVLDLYCWWIPLSSTGDVTAAP